MDILEIEDVLKGLPDQALRQEAQQPTGQVPQYMVVSEIQRRSKMRKRFEAQQELLNKYLLAVLPVLPLHPLR